MSSASQRAIGIGATRHASVSEITAAIAAIEHAAGVTAPSVATFLGAPFLDAATTAARLTGKCLIVIPIAGLARHAGECLTHSERSLAAHGVPSMSEAAALAACGEHARLMGPRLICGPVTAAMAELKQEQSR